MAAVSGTRRLSLLRHCVTSRKVAGTILPEGKRLLENECIPPTRGDIHDRGKNTMDKMAVTQEDLSQYRHVVGTTRQKNDASNVHSRRNQPPKGSSDTRKQRLL